MPIVRLGNTSVVVSKKINEGLDAEPDNIILVPRKDLGSRVTTMHLNEVDGEDRPSRSLNLQTAIRFWDRESDKPPAWVESDDELLAALLADHFGCSTSRPRGWKEG